MQVGKAKQAKGLQNFAVPEREEEILRRVGKQGTLLQKHLPAIYREIISACLACEKPVSAAYLGPIGTYSHEAALHMLGTAAVLSPLTTISTAINSTEKEQTDFSIVPFENSAAGMVGETADCLINTNLKINAEYVLRIRHRMLVSKAHDGVPLADIKAVYAHPQPLEQCRRWLATHMPRAILHTADSTAAAATQIAKSKRAEAAIGSALARDLHQLAELADSIEDFPNNSTRFLMLGHRDTEPTKNDKTSFIITTPDKPGSMYRVLQPLATHGISMTKLESRPAQGRLWEYSFFIDIHGHQKTPKIARALAEMQKSAASFKILGSYPAADK